MAFTDLIVFDCFKVATCRRTHSLNENADARYVTGWHKV